MNTGQLETEVLAVLFRVRGDRFLTVDDDLCRQLFPRPVCDLVSVAVAIKLPAIFKMDRVPSTKELRYHFLVSSDHIFRSYTPSFRNRVICTDLLELERRKKPLNLFLLFLIFF